METSSPWLCRCGEVNSGPACPNCGRMDESALDALNKCGEEVGKAGRDSSLGLGWVTSQSSPTMQRGCFYAILAVVAIPVAAFLWELTRPR